MMTSERVEQLISALRLVLTLDDALRLAIEERTKRPAVDGETGTPEDCARANEIFARCAGGII
jgi:hypothetical protein